jgi:hypothetical protein
MHTMHTLPPHVNESVSGREKRENVTGEVAAEEDTDGLRGAVLHDHVVLAFVNLIRDPYTIGTVVMPDPIACCGDCDRPARPDALSLCPLPRIGADTRDRDTC